jgi:hypothetical protein
MTSFQVIRTPSFDSLLVDVRREHPALERDMTWLIGRLSVGPEAMGNRVMELSTLALPIFKTRCKDTCHGVGASGGWRIYYAVSKGASKVFLLFIHHKREYDQPRAGFLLQKLERAMPDL